MTLVLFLGFWMVQGPCKPHSQVFSPGVNWPTSHVPDFVICPLFLALLGPSTPSSCLYLEQTICGSRNHLTRPAGGSVIWEGCPAGTKAIYQKYWIKHQNDPILQYISWYMALFLNCLLLDTGSKRENELNRKGAAFTCLLIWNQSHISKTV